MLAVTLVLVAIIVALAAVDTRSLGPGAKAMPIC